MPNSQSTQDLVSKHKVLTGFNRFIYFGLVAVAINIINSVIDSYKDYLALYILSGTGCLLIISLWLYRKKYSLTAIILSACVFNLVFILINWHLGLNGGTYLYYFPFILSYIYLFRAEGYNKYVLSFSVLSLACLAFCLIFFPDKPTLLTMPDEKIRQIFIISFCISFSLTIYFFILIFSYQEKLYNKILSLGKEAKRQQLRSLIEAQEASIQSIVHELRNNISQTLVASKFFLEEAGEEGPNKDLIEKSTELTNEALNALTLLCIKTYPDIITDVGFTDAIRQYITELKKISPAEIFFQYDNSDIEKTGERDKISIFRIIQIYLTLVLNNPSTSQVRIEVNFQPASVTLKLSQNDPEFDFMKADQVASLSSINNRIAYFNGILRQQKDEEFATAILQLSIG